jgi:rhamnose utilization protein RhaD (predicted bifunctional aldolase and dehydrogenase)
MSNEDRALFVESIAEMRELKGELHEFKIHVTERFQRLEKNEGQKHRDSFTIAALLISAGMLALNFIAKLQ